MIDRLNSEPEEQGGPDLANALCNVADAWEQIAVLTAVARSELRRAIELLDEQANEMLGGEE